MRLTKTSLLDALRAGDTVLVTHTEGGARHTLTKANREIAPLTFQKVAPLLVEAEPGLLPGSPQTLRLARGC